MAILTPSVIARESLMLLQNNTVAASLVFRGDTQNFMGAQVGDTITIRAPASFVTNEFAVGTPITSQGVNEASVALVLEKHYDISLELTSRQLTLELSDFSKQVIEPAMVSMAEKIDTYLYSKYIQINNLVTVGGGTLSTVGHLAQVDKQLSIQKVPTTGRVGFLSPTTKANFLSIDNIQRLDTRGEAGRAAMTEASLGRAMGVDWYGAQAVPSHVPGTVASTGSLATATGPANPTVLLKTDTNVSVISVTGTGGTGTFVPGDLITIAGVAGQYVVTVGTALVGGAGSITVYPALPASQVVTAAAITVSPAHAANIVGSPRGLSLVSVPLELPMDTEGSNMAAIMNWNGFNIRVVRKYDILLKKNIISFDTLVGAKVTDPRMFVRFNG